MNKQKKTFFQEFHVKLLKKFETVNDFQDFAMVHRIDLEFSFLIFFL